MSNQLWKVSLSLISLITLICVSSYTFNPSTTKGNSSSTRAKICKIDALKIFRLSEKDPFRKGEPSLDYIVRISPSGEAIAIIYTPDKCLRIYYTKDGKEEDYLVPKPTSYSISFSSLNPPMWAPNGSKLLLFGEGPLNKGLLWIVDLEREKIKFLCETVSDKWVKVYQPWNKEGDEVLVAHRGKDLEKVILCIREVSSGKEKEIARFTVTPIDRFNPWFPVKGKTFAIWDCISGSIYYWQNEKGIFAIASKNFVSQKIYGPLPSTKDWVWHDSLYCPRNMWLLADALWKQDVEKSTLLPTKKIFCVLDIKSSKFVYTLTSSLGSSVLIPSISTMTVLPFPKERVFLVRDIVSTLSRRLIWVLDLRKEARKVEIELPIAKSEQILDIQWGKDINTLLVVTTSKRTKKGLEFFKLYAIKILY